MQFSRRLFLAACAAPLALAADRVDPVNHDRRGIAIEGYDPVAYFTEARPVKGDGAYTHFWRGATWRFATPGHRDMFAQAPEQYAPQYGGFCAYAVSENYTAKIDPQAWKVVDGKLYLNYNKAVRATWEKTQPARIAAADRNWPGLHN
jgi:hypothetical protein